MFFRTIYNSSSDILQIYASFQIYFQKYDMSWQHWLSKSPGMHGLIMSWNLILTILPFQKSWTSVSLKRNLVMIYSILSWYLIVTILSSRKSWTCATVLMRFPSQWRRNTKARRGAPRISTCGTGTIRLSYPISTAPSPSKYAVFVAWKSGSWSHLDTQLTQTLKNHSSGHPNFSLIIL